MALTTWPRAPKTRACFLLYLCAVGVALLSCDARESHPIATDTDLAAEIRRYGPGTRCSKAHIFFRGERYDAPDTPFSFYFGIDSLTVVSDVRGGLYAYDRVICYDGRSDVVMLGTHRAPIRRGEAGGARGFNSTAFEERRRFTWFVREDDDSLLLYALAPDEWSVVPEGYHFLRLQRRRVNVRSGNYLIDGVVAYDYNFRRLMVVQLLRAKQVSDASPETVAEAALDQSDVTASSTHSTYRPWWSATVRGEAHIYGVVILSGAAEGYLPDLEITVIGYGGDESAAVCFRHVGPTSSAYRRHLFCNETRTGHEVTITVLQAERAVLSLRSLWVLELESAYAGAAADGKTLRSAFNAARMLSARAAASGAHDRERLTSAIDAWSQWSRCSATCDGRGVQMRLRPCVSEPCTGINADSRPCEAIGQASACLRSNATSASWADWGAWSACSVTCGYGHQTRGRACRGTAQPLEGTPTSPGAAATPRQRQPTDRAVPAAADETDARQNIDAQQTACGDGNGSVEVRSCAAAQSCVYGSWAEWSAWGPCTASPTDCGFRVRTRRCTDGHGRCQRPVAPWFDTVACSCGERSVDDAPLL